jgi:hypothetical protein
MKWELSLLPQKAATSLAVSQILSLNALTSPLHLCLSPGEALELVETRSEALRRYGRVEFSGGIINKLIAAFFDSPYLTSYNYANALNELVEIFFYFKNETLDEVPDDELIAQMKKCFDGACRGDLSLLQGREMEDFARRVRYGGPREPSGEESGEEEENDE